MANVNAPNGFLHIAGAGGSAPTYEGFVAKIASTNTTKIYHGDPVKQLSTGYIAQWTASTGASQLVGIFNGCQYVSVSDGTTKFKPYWPGADATGDVIAFIIPLASGGSAQRFLVQSSGAAITIANVGNNADVLVGSPPNGTLNGISGATLDQTTIATTATLPFRIVGLMSDGTNTGVNGSDTTTSYNRVIVQANIMQQTGI